MFRVRDPKQDERSFESSAELAQAIALGEVGAGWEVFHKRAGAWLPVENHPAYQTFLAARDSRPSGSADATEPRAQPPAGGRQSAGQAGSSRAGKLRTMLALALGSLLVTAGYQAFRATMDRPLPAPAGTPIAATQVPPAADTDPWDAPVVRPSDPLPFERPPEPDTLAPPADAVTSRSAASRATIAPGYAEGYAAARQDLSEGLAYVGFAGAFRPVRLATPDSLRATRRRLAAAANLLRAYRGQELMLEESFRLTVTDSAASLRESFGSAEAGRRLLEAADTLVALLQAHRDRATLEATGVRFEDSRVAAEYRVLEQAFRAELAAAADLSAFTLQALHPGLTQPLPPPALR